MEAASAKLDSSDMRARLRYREPYSIAEPHYKRRPVKRPQPKAFHDVAERRWINYRETLDAPASKPVPAPSTTMAHPKPKAVSPALPRQSHSNILMRNLVSAPTGKVKKKKFSLKKITWPRIAVAAVIVALLVGGGLMSLSGWRANHAVQAQAKSLTAEANKNSSNGSAHGSALSTTKPNVAAYVVAPNMPRYLIIPKLGVKARILQVGVTAQGALATPDNVFDTAWYNESALPGQPGATLIDGHISSWTSPGVFYGLKNLVAGNIIKIQRGDGKMFTYKVVKSKTYSANNVDMQAAMTPIVSGASGLNLISCTGDVIPGTSLFNERIIVFATQV